jgi:transcription elongation factor Elf1
MKAPKQNCPRCNSEQSFRPRSEPGEREGTIVVFIACTMCRWRSDLRISTSELEVLYDRQRRLLEVARQQREKHGVVNGATTRLIANVKSMLGTARREAGL